MIAGNVGRPERAPSTKTGLRPGSRNSGTQTTAPLDTTTKPNVATLLLLMKLSAHTSTCVDVGANARRHLPATATQIGTWPRTCRA